MPSTGAIAGRRAPSHQRRHARLELWARYRRHLYADEDLDLVLDVSRVRFPESLFDAMSKRVGAALDAMEHLEAGGLANADEQRQVGHYWLRAPMLAPSLQRRDIIDAIAQVRRFACSVRSGEIAGPGGRFEHVIHVGIGGSALGPQLVSEACGRPADALMVHFLDNADPDAIDVLLGRLGDALPRTLVSVVSKSGLTPTPWQVMLELEAAFHEQGLGLARQAVATTMAATPLDRRAAEHGWLARFPVWDWVGGRTSVTSPVGLLPAALAGMDIGAFLAGAAAMDRTTRQRSMAANPAVLMALMWYWLGDGRGGKRMVVLPYKDRLALLPRYVQQLVMESVGKRHNRRGEVVEQGLTVYGHKGSTDQHAYMQQLRDGTPDFFITFVNVAHDRDGPSPVVASGATLGDHLFGYAEGSRQALHDRGRDSISIDLPDVSPSSLGALIALYERATGLYGELIDVNAYDQPGVDKYGAADVIALQRLVVVGLRKLKAPATAEMIATLIGRPDETETVFKLLRRLARDPLRGVAEIRGNDRFDARFRSIEGSVL
jgi:glucose-6-phosphate isomerase